MVEFARAHYLLGRAALDGGEAAQALAHFEMARDCPANLRIGRIRSLPEAHLWYHAGLAKEMLGDREGARASFQMAAGQGQLALSVEAYYQAQALEKLGQHETSRRQLEALLDQALHQIAAEVRPGYFDAYGAEVGPFTADLRKRNQVDCSYLIGLAQLGLGQVAEAAQAFRQALSFDANFLEAEEELRRLFW